MATGAPHAGIGLVVNCLSIDARRHAASGPRERGPAADRPRWLRGGAVAQMVVADRKCGDGSCDAGGCAAGCHPSRLAVSASV